MTGGNRHRPRKRFGQHFLHDAGVIRRIVAAIGPQASDTVVEIGPGEGAITRPLLEQHGELTVIEIDRDLIPGLTKKCDGLGTLHVIEADALKVDFSNFARPGARLRVIGNLPYNISSPLLFHLLAFGRDIADMHFMLQREVVERMAAAPGTREYGRLTVMLAVACRVEMLFRIGRGAFTPPPRVESAFVRLTPHRSPPFETGDPSVFARIVSLAFSQRRKTLRNALRGTLSESQLREAGVDPGARGETLAPADFGRLARLGPH